MAASLLRSQCKKNMEMIDDLSSGIPACESAPCLNGGSCTDTDTGFTCTCTKGWRGNTCEESKFFPFFELFYLYAYFCRGHF